MKQNAAMFTGYRPEKFGFSLTDDNPDLALLERRLYFAVTTLVEKGVKEFYVGMAMGFDIIAGEYVAALKAVRKDIKLYAAVPFPSQPSTFPSEWKARYDALKKQADEVFTLSDTYEKWAFQKRNRFMVDNSAYCITYFDGKKGGTASTVRYAESKGLEIINVFNENPFKKEENTIGVLLSMFDEIEGTEESEDN